MRASIAAVALFALALAGCAGTGPTAPAPTAVAPAAGTYTEPGQVFRQSAPPLPIAGRCEATYAELPVVAPSILRHVSVGTCRLSHLGQVSLRAEAEINVATGVQTAEVTFTAANGDRVEASSVGTGTALGPITVRFTGAASIVGGTGRFANATGEMGVQGMVGTATGDARFEYDGWIAYDPSDQSRR